MAPSKSSSLKKAGSGSLFGSLLGKDSAEPVQVPAKSTPSQKSAQTAAAVAPPSPAASMPSAAAARTPSMNGQAAVAAVAAPAAATTLSTPSPAASPGGPKTPGASPQAAAAVAAAGAAPAAAKGGPKIGIEDARAAWQPKPRIPVRLLDNYINFMVMGDSGLGKTTFIDNLTSSYKVKSHAEETATTMAAFQASPESLRTFLEPMDIPEAGRRLHVAVQDMPGWGDDINLVRYLKLVLSYIMEQRAKDYELLEGSRAMNEVAMCGQLQNSITACVYFLAPHRVKKVDLILISAISQLVTVIPVIAKADSMTEGEISEYRTEIRNMLANPAKFAPSRSLPPLAFNHFSWDSDVMATLGLDPEHLPLALVTSKETDTVHSAALLADLGLDPSTGGVSQPVRKYRWGTAYSLNRDHSDLLLLKRLLMGDRVDSLYAMLDESYSRYIDFCAKYEESGKQLPVLVQAASALSTPYLEYDDYTKAQAALDAAQQAMSTLMAENKALLDRLNTLERSTGRNVVPSAIATQGSGGRIL